MNLPIAILDLIMISSFSFLVIIILSVLTIKNKTFQKIINFIILPLIFIDFSYFFLVGKEIDPDTISRLNVMKEQFAKIENIATVNKDNIKNIYMLFEEESIERLKKEITSNTNKSIKIYSTGGFRSTASEIGSIIKLLRKHNKKIIVSNFCYSMCANFIALIPKDLLIHTPSSSISFHLGSNLNKRIPVLIHITSTLESMLFHSLIYFEYIKDNSTLTYIEFMSDMNKTGEEKWVRCEKQQCSLIAT